jgi:hypothetical protein
VRERRKEHRTWRKEKVDRSPKNEEEKKEGENKRGRGQRQEMKRSRELYFWGADDEGFLQQ